MGDLLRTLFFATAVLANVCFAQTKRCVEIVRLAGDHYESMREMYHDSPEVLDQVIKYLRTTFPEFSKDQPMAVFYSPEGKPGETLIEQLSAAFAEYSAEMERMTRETEQRSKLTTPGYQMLPPAQRLAIEGWIERVKKLDHELAVHLETALALQSPNSAKWKRLTTILDKYSSPLLDLSLVATVRRDRDSANALRVIRNALNNDIGSFNRPLSADEDRFVRHVKNASSGESSMIIDWLRMLELNRADKYHEVLKLASELPPDHPRWEFIMPKIRETMNSDVDWYRFQNPADQFTESAYAGGNAKNRVQFNRPLTDFEGAKLANVNRRNDMWLNEKKRLSKEPDNWDIIEVPDIFYFVRRVEDISPQIYTDVLNTVSNWEPQDPRWQSLKLRLPKRSSKTDGDFDLAQDIIKNEL